MEQNRTEQIGENEKHVWYGITKINPINPIFWDGEIVDNNLQIDKAAKNSYSTFVNLQNMLVTSIALYLFGPTKKVLSPLILVCYLENPQWFVLSVFIAKFSGTISVNCCEIICFNSMKVMQILHFGIKRAVIGQRLEPEQ